MMRKLRMGGHAGTNAERADNYKKVNLTSEDAHYVNIMRGLSILRVVLVHLGLSWFYPPYSQYVGIFLPVLFFVSGAVSYYSFLRSRSIGEYLIKRLVLVIVPFYVFSALVLLITAVFYSDKFPDAQGLLNWLFVWPEFQNIFFPLNQVWFINCLIAMILLSAPIFFFARRRPWILCLAVVFSLALSFLNVPFSLYESVSQFPLLVKVRWGHQAWQTLIFLGIYIYGALHYQYFSGRSAQRHALAAGAFLLLAFVSYLYVELGFELKEHTKHKSLYYLFLSFFAIYVLLAFQRPLSIFLARLRPLESLLLYTNRYAYSVYLLHTLVLFCVEEWLDLTDLGDQPALALVRMFLVLIITLIIAKPLGDLSRNIAHSIREKLLGIKRRVRTYA